MSWPKNVQTMQRQYEIRRQALLDRAGSGPLAHKHQGSRQLYGAHALMDLVRAERLEQANARLRHVCGWFDRPPPRGRNHRGEVDFAAIRLGYALCRFADQLEPATIEAIEGFFRKHDFQSMHPSENHELLFHAIRHLVGQARPEWVFEAYDRRRGAELSALDAHWLKRFIRFRARQGWGEFDALGYAATDWQALAAVYDLTEDVELKRLARAMMNVLLVDWAVDSLDGRVGGAHGRSPEGALMDFRKAHVGWLMYLHFGLGEPTRGCFAEIADSSFRAEPLVIDIALNRRERYANHERKHLHHCSDPLPAQPGPGSIRKYAWWTPNYLLGCVQKQDPYGPVSPDAWYAHHQQVQWSLLLAGDPRAVIFTQHPGPGGLHKYWVGADSRCGGAFFQHQSALVGLHEVPADAKFDFVHAYLPKDVMDEVVEREGFVFARLGDSYAGIKLLNGYRWTTRGEWAWVELVSPGPVVGVVVEAGSVEEFGTFESFMEEVTTNSIRLDAKSKYLEYGSQRAGTIALDANGGRLLNGQPADLEYPTWDSPFLRSAWDRGVVELHNNGRSLQFDFRAEQSSP